VNERDLGELIGTVRGMAERMASLETATRAGFHDTQRRIEVVSETWERKQTEHAKEWRERIGALERWRFWIMGALAFASLLYALGLVLVAQRLGP
jgi:hypothetical protein